MLPSLRPQLPQLSHRSFCVTVSAVAPDPVAQWWRVIFRVSETLERAGIPYSFDASTSVFVHGIPFDMDDADVMVQWSDHEASRAAFRSCSPTPIAAGEFSHFRFRIDDHEVHILSSERIVDLSKDAERVRIVRDGRTLWSKDVHFYRRHIDGANPLAALIDRYLANSANLDFHGHALT